MPAHAPIGAVHLSRCKSEPHSRLNSRWSRSSRAVTHIGERQELIHPEVRGSEVRVVPFQAIAYDLFHVATRHLPSKET